MMQWKRRFTLLVGCERDYRLAQLQAELGQMNEELAQFRAQLNR